jgi:hypothetical protein
LEQETEARVSRNSELVIIPVKVEAGGLWSSVFGGGWEFFGNHIKSVEFLNGSSWEEVGLARITALDPKDEDKTITVEVGIHKMVEAYAELLSQDTYASHSMAQSFYGNSEFDFDAMTSDCVIQQMVYGEVVYG